MDGVTLVFFRFTVYNESIGSSRNPADRDGGT
ncbi:hypothetical protein KBTX_03527 [wastewater metagenome]|uniref:Uncharacterized protein n=2 Tax=unclassified sequences TaxID=12908 RepID=A0A5B8REX6_9ZZZZ|nr:hypothetical protein KBTEX_03527 [uncultured organism]